LAAQSHSLPCLTRRRTESADKAIHLHSLAHVRNQGPDRSAVHDFIP